MSLNFLELRSGIKLGALTSAPGSPSDGEIYYDSTLGQFQFRQNGNWIPIPSIVASNNQVIYQDNSGNIVGFPELTRDTTTGAPRAELNFTPNGETGGVGLVTEVLNVTPAGNTPDLSYSVHNSQTSLDTSTGSLGSNGRAVSSFNTNINHTGTEPVGELNFFNNSFTIGNGTDPVDSRGFSYVMGFGQVSDNVNIVGPIQGFIFQPSIATTATVDVDNMYVAAFADSTNAPGTIMGPYNSINIGPTLGGIANNKGYNGLSLYPNIADMQGNANANMINISGVITGSGNTNNWNGLYVNPQTVTGMQNAYGIWASMDNVSVFAGTQASVTIQDLFYESILPGTDGNSISIEYIGGGTAGSEVVSNIGPAVTVQIEDGVSNADQIKAALDVYPIFASNATVIVTGTGTNAQVIQGPTNLTGGANPGQKLAAFLDGDVIITGSLDFNGDLQIGKLDAFFQVDVEDGGGNPQTVHSLISAIQAPASTTTANADTIGVNTASLITLQANSVTTSGPFQLGISAIALPCVVQTHTGSSLDVMSAATYAINLDAGSTGGTIDTVKLNRVVAIPNGITTINKLRGFVMDLPFGDVATDTWGIYIEPASAQNWMKKSLKIGGTAGTTDVVTNSSINLEVETSLRKEPITNTVRDALTAVAGMEVYSSDDNQPQYYDGTSWQSYSQGVGFTTPTTGSSFGNVIANPGMTGGSNTVVGVGASTLITTGTANTVYGAGAGSSIDTSVQNVVIGAGAASSMTGGGDNIVIGNSAGSGITTAISNVVIGAAAASLSMGNRNVVIGAGAGVNATVEQAIAIGFNAVASNNNAVLGSVSAPINTLYIGYGEEASGGSDNVVYTNTNGVGTDNSISTGEVALGGARGTGTGNGGRVVIKTAPPGASGSSLNSWVDRIVVEDTGEVGIGTSTPISGLDVDTSQSRKFTSITGDLTLDNTHNVIIADATSALITITLPAAATATRREYTIKKVDNVNNIDIVADGSELIDGLGTQSLTTQYQYITIISDGSNWHIIG